MTDTKDLLLDAVTIGGAAELLGVGYITVWKMTQKREIETVRVGGRVYIKREVLREYIRRNTIPAQDGLGLDRSRG